MIQIGSGNNSKLQARVPYWNLPYYKDMDIVFDATKGGFLNKPNYGNDLASLVTDTHTSTIMAPNSAGIYSNFGPNSLVRTDLGLQTVPTRTNGVRNSSFIGAVAGNPGNLPNNMAVTVSGGISYEITGVGTEFGLPYADFRFFGTASSSVSLIVYIMATNDGVPASSSQTWTSSVFLKLISGSISRTSWIQTSERNSANTEITSHSNSFIATNNLTRFEAIRTLTNAETTKVSNSIRFTIVSGDVVDFTIRIAAPQLEQGAFATPPILTSGTTATVAGNQQVITGLGPSLMTGVAGFIDFDLLGLPSSGQFPRLFQFDNGNGQNRICLVLNGSSNVFSFEVWNNNINQANINLGASSIGRNCFAFIATENYVIARKVGDVQRPIDNSVSYPIVNDRFSLSGESFTSNNNTYKYTKKAAIRFLKPGDNPETVFNEVFAQAQLAHAA